MAKRVKLNYLERQELADVFVWLRQPPTSQFDEYYKVAVWCFVKGRDPVELLTQRGVENVVAERAAAKARVYLGNHRARRRNQAAQILEARRPKVIPGFTFENFRVNMETRTQEGIGMVSVSIYCLVEVWEDDDNVEKEYLVNFSDYKTKEWLTRLMVWALMNKRQVLIKPASELEMNSMKMFVPAPKERA